MRTFFIVLLCFLSSFAYADQTVALAPFDSIAHLGIANVKVNVGGEQKVTLSGDPGLFEEIKLSVKDARLTINSTKQTELKKLFKSNSTVIINITIPTLTLFKSEGVGNVVLNNLSGKRIDIAFEGVGNLDAQGSTKWLRLKGRGVGNINTQKLIAVDADVDFDGVGNVDITATNKLNAVVSGMGSVTYYGNPQIINKKVDGVGSFKAGK